MTDLTTSTTHEAREVGQRPGLTMAIGLFGGLALGVIARVWMRLISDTPEFTWTGTLFIVLGFTIFGLTQSIVAVARRKAFRRRTLTMVRAIGVVGMLPLFVAAGAIMLPTVAGGGLAVARPGWSRITRGICLVIALGPVLFVGSDLVDKFGWSTHSITGFVVMLAIYGTIIRSACFALAPQADGWRLPRRATVTIVVVVGLLFLIPLYFGGIN